LAESAEADSAWKEPMAMLVNHRKGPLIFYLSYLRAAKTLVNRIYFLKNLVLKLNL